MTPRSRAARLALSALFVFHLGMVINYVWLDDRQRAVLEPVSRPWVEWLQLSQRWNMFRNPALWDVFIEAERTLLRCATAGAPPWTCAAEVEPLDISMAPPNGPFLRLRYDRMVKVHNNLANEDAANPIYGRLYAEWLCRQAPAVGEDDWLVLTLYKRRVRHYRGDELQRRPLPPHESTRAVHLSVVCAAPRGAS